MKRSEKAAFVCLVLGLVVVTAFGVFYGIAKQRARAARAKVMRPVAIDTYAEMRNDLPDDEAGVPANPSLAVPPVSDETLKNFAMLRKFDEAWEADQARAELIGLLGDPVTEWPDDRLDALRELMVKMRPFCEAIRAAAAQGGPVYPLDFSSGYAMELPHLAYMRQFARYLRGDAYDAMEHGDVTRAVDDFVAMEQLGEAVVDEPVLISQLVRHAISGIAFSSMGELLPRDLSHDDASRLIDVLSRMDYREAFADAYGGEAAMGEVYLQDPDMDALDISSASLRRDNEFEYWVQQGFGRLYASPLGSPFVAMDEASFLDIMGDIQATARLPFYEAVRQAEAIEREIDDLSVLHVFSRQMLPALTRAYAAQARHEAYLDVAQLGIAVEQFRNDMGAYPQSLDEVASQIPGGLPVDPFSGESYVYRVTGDGFILYSINMDREDDGGVYDRRDGDLVWRGVEETEPGQKAIQVAQSQ